MIGTNAWPSNPEAMEPWQRLLVIGVVLVATFVAVRLIDRRIMGATRSPEAMTRYRVLRRTISAGIVTVGLLSALLVIPQVRAVAGGLLASTAVLGLIIGFAAQRTLGNFVAGLMIAMTQPLRIGDWVEVGGLEGAVEEITLMYTFIRTEDNAQARDPEREAGLGYHPQLHDSQRSEVRRGHSAGSPFSRSSFARRGPSRGGARGAGRGLRQLARWVADPDAAGVDRE